MIPAAVAPLRTAAQVMDPSTLMVIIDDIPDSMDASLLEAVLSEFLDRGIAVSCVVDIARLDPSAANGSSRLGAMIREIAARKIGLLEIIVPAFEVEDPRRYFQMRSAETLRASAAAFLAETSVVPRRDPIVSLMDRNQEDAIDLAALRSGGGRVLIRPDARGPMSVEFAGRGQMRVQGGITLPVNGSREENHTQLEQNLNSGRDVMLILSLSGTASLDAERLRNDAAGIAARIDAVRWTGSVVARRPLDYLLEFGPYQMADRALVLDSGNTDEEEENLAAFAEELRAAGLPFSVTGASAPQWLSETDDFCPEWPAALADHPVEELAAHSRILSSAPLPTPAPDWVPGLMVVPGDGGAWNGIRSDGRMQLVYREWASAGAAANVPLEDLVLRIRPRDVVSPTLRQLLLHELVSMVGEGEIRLHTVAQLGDLVIAPEPVQNRLWSTRQRMVTDPPRDVALSAGERAEYLEDARLAWRFIDRFTDPATGLCAGTVRGGPGMRVNREATLWDIASQLQGIVAAGSMGLIARDEARDRVQTALRNVPTIDLAGMQLPPAMFLTDRTAQVSTMGFDSCDTGRFLIALRTVVAAGLASEEDAVAARRQWDLAEMVQDGRTFDLANGRRVDVTVSHCTPYIARAFAELGLPLNSPYSRLGRRSGADDLMRLLYSAAFIGSLGTEPLLLEAIEQGASPETEFLSDVLFDAQLSWYEETGVMKCVSEAPLNFEPYFSYQGLRLDRLGEEAWTIGVGDPSLRFQTEAFRERAELLSAKSAYLWAAVHPHPYCDMLVDVMRDKGRIENLGFSVGVFTRTLEAMENYSDLNTNGVILSAIAAMLEPSWPGSH